ncbi:MAG: DUF3108 domain-containing protein [Opitutaceae bacterium]|jgi:hypothetical protein|nr:DUF3108 domain-containing protein [Opitutaceae bacterium]NBR57709.1 DUF3108 domain-containing protein [Opitutaceae bacterium]
MMRLLVKIILISFWLIGISHAAPFTAFRDGESFTYRVSFAIFPHAGDLTIAAHAEEKAGAPIIRVTTNTKSHGIVRQLYAFDNQAEVVIDQVSGRMLRVRESGADPKRATDTEITFNYATRTADYTDRVRPQRSVKIMIPEGNPVDLISALVQTRDWHLQPGMKRDLLVQFGREFYLLSIYADHYEEVSTPLGVYQTLVLIPRMESNPKGLFKKGGEIKVWIAQDNSNLPVKMQLKLNFGAATLLLSEYQPPVSAK